MIPLDGAVLRARAADFLAAIQQSAGADRTTLYVQPDAGDPLVVKVRASALVRDLLAALDAQQQRLDATNEKLTEWAIQLAGMALEAQQLEARSIAAEAACAALRAALEKYGQHLFMCQGALDAAICVCGLSKALTTKGTP